MLGRWTSKFNKLLHNDDDLITVVQGDGLQIDDVNRTITKETEAILFAVGVKSKTSPPDLCTNVTRNILNVMRAKNASSRFVWCGGGSNLRSKDAITTGAKFVQWFANTCMQKKHMDKEHQLELLDTNKDIPWFGVRPLQMKKGPKTGEYRIGYDRFSGLSKISFADCAHAMMNMLEDDTWAGDAPIVQY